VCHSWSILGFLNRLSAFILYFRVAEIAEIFAFMMAFAFLESLLVAGVLALLSAIMPSKWLRDGFGYKGFIFMVIATIAAIIFQKNLKEVLPPLQVLTLYWVAPFVLTVVIISVVQRMPRARSILLNLADRFSIMLFVYVPIGLLSLMVVALRNLL
jgi:Na+/melibiose symporter-like transporter